jgi:predicted small metal-binding protein
MSEPERWNCECGYSEAMTGDDTADLRAWAGHVRDAHGEAALEETLRTEIDAYIEKLKVEGKVLHDPFNGHDYFVEEPDM